MSLGSDDDCVAILDDDEGDIFVLLNHERILIGSTEDRGEGFCEDDLDVYAAGLLASEYLIGQYGLDAVTRIHGEFKYSVDWETRVSTVYGKSPDALNREIAEYLRSFASIFP